MLLRDCFAIGFFCGSNVVLPCKWHSVACNMAHTGLYPCPRAAQKGTKIVQHFQFLSLVLWPKKSPVLQLRYEILADSSFSGMQSENSSAAHSSFDTSGECPVRDSGISSSICTVWHPARCWLMNLIGLIESFQLSSRDGSVSIFPPPCCRVGRTGKQKKFDCLNVQWSHVQVFHVPVTCSNCYHMNDVTWHGLTRLGCLACLLCRRSLSQIFLDIQWDHINFSNSSLGCLTFHSKSLKDGISKSARTEGAGAWSSGWHS